MGWKGAVRSINAAHKKSVRAHEKALRAEQKAFEKTVKKLQKLEDAREKVKVALNNEYAKGKIDDERYQELSNRLNEVTDELFAFGKAAGITLAKRYVCGQIDKDDFERMKTEFIPDELEDEKNKIVSSIERKQSELIDFVSSYTDTEGACAKCGKQKGFFSPLRDVDGHLLCGSCQRNLNLTKRYLGFNGTYLVVDSCVVEEKMSLHIQLKEEWL